MAPAVTYNVLRGKGSVVSLSVPADASVIDLKKEYARKFPKMSVTRQRMTIERDTTKTVLQNDSALSTYNIKEGETILLKDLGPQVDYRQVFFIEYFGPIVMHLVLFYGYQQYFGVEHSPVKRRLLYMFTLHFIKREFETMFVHRFSNATMPLMNLFKNSGHYWILGGLFTGIELFYPSHQTMTDMTTINILTAVWAFAQLSNLTTHIILRNLRRPGTRERNIPRGYGFNLVSCPNYTFEILGWIAYSIIAQAYFGFFFTIVGAVQMALWAIKKHKAYRKEFPNYPRGRKILIPFVW